MTRRHPRVRPATPIDREVWRELRTALWPEGAADHAGEIDRFFRGGLPALGEALLAEIDGAVVGFAEVSIRPCAEGCETSRVGYLEGWYVRRRSRGRGVGRALVEAAETWARERGCAEFASDTRAGNEVSRKAHLACGFEDVGLVRCFRKRLEEVESSG